MAELVVKGESVAVDMRAATTEGAGGVVELAVKGEPMAVGMRAATIKGAFGVAELAVKGEPMAVDMRAPPWKALSIFGRSWYGWCGRRRAGGDSW